MAESKEEMTADQARLQLRSAGLRCTSCRVAVLQYLDRSPSPLSHAEVAEQLVPQGFEKSTIYRCLIEMADGGLLSRLELGDHVWRFEMRRANGKHVEEHPHFMCVDCGQVTCLPNLNVRIGSPRGKNRPPGVVTEVLLKGHCQVCQTT